MSCLHGNHPDACDICDEVDAAYERGAASRDQALRDLEAENARLQSAWHVETLNEKDRLIAAQEAENDRVKSRLATADALLRECDEVARKRGDKYKLCDAIDNDGEPYQSAHLAAHLGAKHV